MRRFPNANIEQTLVTFQSFFTTSIDRGIEINQIDVEKSIWAAMEKIGEINGAQAKVPENRDAPYIQT